MLLRRRLDGFGSDIIDENDVYDKTDNNLYK